MLDGTHGCAQPEREGGWPAAVQAVCAVMASPAAVRRLAWIIVLMIVLVLVAKFPMSALHELSDIPLPPLL